MNNILKVLLISASIITVTNSYAETVYVNNKPIDSAIIKRDLDQISKSSPMAAQQLNNAQFKHEVLKSIGTQEAILEEAKSEGLDKDPAVQAKIEQIKPMIYAQIMEQKTLAQKPTDSELQAKFKATAANFTQYDVSHILVKDEKTAKEVLAKLKKGASFKDLAKQYSIDPGSKKSGGELGLTDGSSFVPDFTKAFKALKVGEYTQNPVKTQYGYHIIKLNSIKQPTFAAVKDTLTRQVQQEKVKSYFEQLNTKYKVEVK